MHMTFLKAHNDVRTFATSSVVHTQAGRGLYKPAVVLFFRGRLRWLGRSTACIFARTLRTAVPCSAGVEKHRVVFNQPDCSGLGWLSVIDENKPGRATCCPKGRLVLQGGVGHIRRVKCNFLVRVLTQGR